MCAQGLCSQRRDNRLRLGETPKIIRSGKHESWRCAHHCVSDCELMFLRLRRNQRLCSCVNCHSERSIKSFRPLF